MSQNEYKEIRHPKTGVYKQKGSKFIAYTFPVYSPDQIKEILTEVKKIESGARHHCYAYILHPDKSSQRTNDDGEPSSTAGKPILGQILSNDLTNILIIVCRYFGGTKLGVPGLINAYKKAAEEAISKSKVVTRFIKEHYKVIFKYDQINNVMRIIKEHNLKIIDRHFRTKCKIVFTVEKKKIDLVLNAFKKNHELKINQLKNIQ